VNQKPLVRSRVVLDPVGRCPVALQESVHQFAVVAIHAGEDHFVSPRTQRDAVFFVLRENRKRQDEHSEKEREKISCHFQLPPFYAVKKILQTAQKIVNSRNKEKLTSPEPFGILKNRILHGTWNT
jgi:isocitrate/isopropylmalate dehydrogenase